MRQFTIELHEAENGLFGITMKDRAESGVVRAIPLSEGLMCSYAKALGFAEEFTGLLTIVNPAAAVIFSNLTTKASIK